MERLAALFEHLSLPEVARLLRRTAYSAIGVGVVAFVVALILSYALVGFGVCVGLALGLANIRLVTRSVAQLSESPVAKPKRVLASRSLTRLGITTVIVIGLMFASVQVGLGAFAGIAAFYFVLTANVVRAILHPDAPGVPA